PWTTGPATTSRRGVEGSVCTGTRPSLAARAASCVGGLAVRGLGALGVGADVDAPTRQLRGKTRVLALLADRERQLEVRDDDPCCARGLVDDRDRRHP